MSETQHTVVNLTLSNGDWETARALAWFNNPESAQVMDSTREEACVADGINYYSLQYEHRNGTDFYHLKEFEEPISPDDEAQLTTVYTLVPEIRGLRVIHDIASRPDELGPEVDEPTEADICTVAKVLSLFKAQRMLFDGLDQDLATFEQSLLPDKALPEPKTDAPLPEAVQRAANLYIDAMVGGLATAAALQTTYFNAYRKYWVSTRLATQLWLNAL